MGKKKKSEKSSIEMGRHKLNDLRRKFANGLASDEEKEQLEKYELFERTEKQKQKTLDYSEAISKPKSKNIPHELTPDNLLTMMRVYFEDQTGRELIRDQETFKDIDPLIYYFVEDERFFECENVISEICPPSFSKGLFIVGDYGNGKSSYMRALQKAITHFPQIEDKYFGAFNALDVVEDYEIAMSGQAKKDFWDSKKSGNKFFDDVKTERMANNYGKIELFEELFQKRYDKICRDEIVTHVACNYDEKAPGNFAAALGEFQMRYGGRLADRIFDMFNFIEFKAKSKRGS